ncbi:MAG: argininosuccinate lyase [Thermoanaerobaculia bacterium]
MWGGRFASATDARLRALNDSLRFDWELLSEDVEGSIAWATALEKADVLSAREAGRIRKALAAILKEAPAEPPLQSGAEDVHSWVEAKLREKVGALAGKLHTGRSRNDQVATDFRLYLRKAFREGRALAFGLAEALASRAEAEAATVMPGYTHSKQAEPVTFGHWCLAYAEMVLRDVSRLEDASKRADECPLGSGALAGSPVVVDRAALASSLGFSRPTANSLDAVSDRDAAAEYLFASTLLLVHVSRMAEDLIFFSSDEAGFVELPDALATGSSRMPQKKNPDLLELARGHAARALGELTGLLALLKALPLAYDKDLQLDKEPVFRVRRVLSDLLPLLSSLVEGLILNRDAMRAAASSEALLATAVADRLAEMGVPFREAHERVSRAIGRGEKLEVEGATPEEVVAKKDVIGGTAPKRVRAAAKDIRKRAKR